MKVSRSLSGAVSVLCFAAAAFLSTSAAAQSAQPGWESGKWQFTANIYGLLPVIDGKVNFPGDLGSSDIHFSRSDIINHLKMTFMGALDAHNGRWGVFNDVLYMDLGGTQTQTRDFSIGGIAIPATATTTKSVDLKSWVWTVAGEYRVAADPAWTVDLLAGGRMLYVKPRLNWSITGDVGPIVLPGRSGTKSISDTLWDGIVGVKGRYAFGDNRKWFVPFYLDVGTGATSLTWQAAGGVGYAYSWGEVVAVWRYLDWNGKSGKPIADLNMSGPQLGVALHF